MIKQPNRKMVVIEPFALEQKGLVESTEKEQEAQHKKQNRGKVILVGSAVEWPSEGDTVSFYRNAATTIEEDGNEYLIVHCEHILVKF